MKGFQSRKRQVPIKFRGRRISDGKYVYGDLRHNYHYANRTEYGIEDWKNSYYYQVMPESVAQLVGYDKNGAEVYEGDVIWTEFYDKRYEYKAHKKGFATTEDGCYVNAEKFSEMELVS